MTRPGAIVFRIVHEPSLRHEYLIEDGQEPKWGTDRTAALFFKTHHDADMRAQQLRTEHCFVSSIVVEGEREQPAPFVEREPRAPQHRRPRQPVKLFGYDD
jgi:hypothetical protein